MHKLTLTALIGVTRLINALEFIAPDTDRKLNLSAPITIEWTLNNEGNAEWTEVDLWWYGQFSNGGGNFGFAIEENFTTTGDGTYGYNWNPASEVESFTKNQNTLSSDKVFYFLIKRHAPNSTSASTLEPSEKYAVEGNDLIGSSASLMKPMWGVAVAGLAAAFALI
ncbi:hypothetical protein COL154_007058 [Colletotrichum chrysophilum]|uniref:uncharacterized protein n=1 Tax=Colletotrichum chrysophilum TaxID=1836956 RepID=UPI002301336A|nr:uncharacterized protein COL26b_004618 [Colletotrichum chrysophilum]KAJ0347286.1 hypothetical protein KNSL1_006645 [Colletotrichum chrysophilum]KAJ0361191.1 hypothetical protein COL154_007058 [Colletotrichum chrysophilum]KAJ0377176.1 hypothetical protein COL26b_004618 [Colletotrichum chrysophilum]